MDVVCWNFPRWSPFYDRINKGFVSVVKKENKNIITTRCFLHQEALVAKILENELKTVLNKVVKILNFLKSRSLKSRLFSKLSEEIRSRHVSPLLHTKHNLLIELKSWIKIIAPLISEHLEILERNIMKYFPDMSIIKYDWLRNFFLQPNTQQLSLNECKVLSPVRDDRPLKLKHSEVLLETFWLELKDEFLHVTKRAITILLQFSTSYLCEIGFCCLKNIKNMKRFKLQSVDHEMRICLPNISPNIPRICKSK